MHYVIVFVILSIDNKTIGVNKCIHTPFCRLISSSLRPLPLSLVLVSPEVSLLLSSWCRNIFWFRVSYKIKKKQTLTIIFFFIINHKYNINYRLWHIIQTGEFEFPSWRGTFDTTLCDKVCQWLATGRWFSKGTPVSSTKKTDRDDISEILLKVVLNTITLIHK
jgi:hypothetical protein